ncbi:hypothetical protein [Haloferula sp.]|uniref:hypothetical protein n=1 Tax=Haloferula sp. TaxID=2497595 RepID=UPI00329D248F
MFSAKQLTEAQKTSLNQWAAEGASIADLQNRMKEEFQIGMTYMDARFMVLDLGIEIQTEKVEEPEATEVVEELKPEPTGFVEVTMDSIAMPGALVSGKVTFSDGGTAVWMLDEQGRPGLDPDTPGYRPSEEDVMSFQKQLSELIRQKGM